MARGVRGAARACGGGSMSLPRLAMASGSLRRLSCATASGRLSSRFRFAFSASCFRAFFSASSRRGASSFDFSTDLNLSSLWIAASAIASSPTVS